MRCDILTEARRDNLGDAARSPGAWNGALRVKWCEVCGGGLISKARFLQGAEPCWVWRGDPMGSRDLEYSSIDNFSIRKKDICCGDTDSYEVFSR